MRFPRLLVIAGCVAACREVDAPGTPPHLLVPQVLVGAGDIATCTNANDEATAALLDEIPGVVFTAGDNQHDNGPGANLKSCYAPTWGRHLNRTVAVIGNHDYDQGAGEPHFDYFGERAGPRGAGYYSFDLGAWHIVVLNSDATHIGTGRGSPQEQWLRADLAAHRTTRCTMAIWHHPRFYQGEWGLNAAVLPFWEALIDAGADVVVNAHFHLYERYAPQLPDGTRDGQSGIRQFIVGTGGKGHDVLITPRPNVEVRDNTSFGVLKLTLRGGDYDWEFVPVAGSTFTDSGSGHCH